MPSDKMRRRLLGLRILFVVLLLAMIFNLAVIMLAHSNNFKKLADTTQFYENLVPAHRGAIMSSDTYDTAEILAQSATIYDAYIDRSKFAQELLDIYETEQEIYAAAISPDFLVKMKYKFKGEPLPAAIPFDLGVTVTKLIRSLAKNLEIEETVILEKLQLGETVNETLSNGETISTFFPYDIEFLTTEKVYNALNILQNKGLGGVLLKADVPKQTVDEINALLQRIGENYDNDGTAEGRRYTIGSVNFRETSTRYYPKSTLAAPVIGFLTAGDSFGVEKTYNDYLEGKDGLTITAKDANGNEMYYRNSERIPAVDGNDVYLTIDTTVQSIMEKQLKTMCDTYEVANYGSAIMMNVKTGAIIAMASYPSIDLNNPYKLATTDYLK
ncbi:MAG: hypothetical protein LBM93_14600, partial [Oscillospiraceae bacterium]|nr:hypothetical protein [Oscillospiraceae bacterium]